MKKFYTTLLLLMALITAVPSAYAGRYVAEREDDMPVKLPWTPEIGFLYGSAARDFDAMYSRNEFTVNGLKTSNGWAYESASGGWSLRSRQNSEGTVANPNMNRQNSFLWLPSMEFQAGETYVLRFKAYSSDTRCTGGQLRVLLTDSRDVDVIPTGQQIMAPTEIHKAQTPIGQYPIEEFIVYFTAEKSGVQSIVFNCTSIQGAGPTYLYEVNSNMSVKRTHPSLPAAPTNLTVTPDPNGRKEATVSFTAPTLTVMGQPITEMTYLDVLIDGNRAERINNPVPGQNYTVTIKGTQASDVVISVRGGNTHGNGDEASIDATLGYSLQEATYTTKLRDPETNKFIIRYLMYATFDNNTAKIEWPIAAQIADQEGATYSVIRYPDNKIIAQGITETSCIDPDVSTDYPANFQYELFTNVDGVETRGVYSNPIAINNDMPYRLKFDSQSSQNEMCWDSPDDDYKFSTTTSLNSKGIGIGWGTPKGDWLITPSVKLEKDKYYKIEIASNISTRPFTVSVFAGKQNTPAAMTQTILDTYLEKVPADRGGSTHSGFFRVEDDDAYFFGVHASLSTVEPNSFHIPSFNVLEVDPQLPGAVEDIKVEFDTEKPTKAKLTFKASSKSISGTDITELSAIRVLKDGEHLTTIENPTPGQEITLDIEAMIGEQIVYTMIPVLGETEGVEVELPVSILTAPYTNDFTATKQTAGWTIIDPANDGFSWGLNNGCIYCYPIDEDSMDDWFITAPIMLEGDKFYKLQYVTGVDTDAHGINSTSTVALFMGTEPTIEGMTQQVVETYQPHYNIYNSGVLVKDYVYIPTSGVYYFGFNAKGNTQILVDNFSISDKINPGVPDKAVDLAIKPDWNGGLSSEISFVSAGKTMKGEPLYGDINYVIYRDGAPISSVTTTPNKFVTVKDAGMTEGVHLYSVYGSNTEGLGREAEDVAFIGVNRPYVPSNFDVRETDTYGTVLLTWEAPESDYDGFPINPDLITYDVFLYNPDDGTEQSIAKDLKEFSYTHKAKGPNDKQAFLRYGIRARTRAGGSPGLLARFVNVGEPYTLPVKESFPGCRQTICQVMECLNGYAAWGYNGTDNAAVNCFDNDNGMGIMESMFIDSEARLFTGKVRISGDNPYISLFVYNNKNTAADDENILAIEVGKPREWTTLAEKSVNEWANGLEGWQKIRVDLSDYKDQVIHFAFRSICKTHTFTHIDAITIGESGMDDLTIANTEAPRRVNPGEEFTLKTTVKNNGLTDADVYTLRLYRNKTLIGTVNGEAIKPGESKVYEFTDAVDKSSKESVYDYTFDLRYSPDVDQTDNRISGLMVSVRPSEYLPMVENLNATVNNSDVALTWDVPTLKTEPTEVVEDVEGLTAWAGSSDVIGDWISLNKDGGRSLLTLRGLADTPFAQRESEGWFVLDASHDALIEANNYAGYEFYSAHSGNQCFAAEGLANQEAYCNDWLISPELSGEAQTISFWARSGHSGYYATLTVLTSEGTPNMRDFSEVGSLGIVPIEWDKISFDVPEGTKYFAIRNRGYASYLLLVDDITFTPAGEERLNMEGIKVYHNGKELETLDKNVTSFEHKGVEDGNHKYAVAVKYDKGESADATANVETTALEAAYINGPMATGLTGCILVTGAEGMAVKVFDAAGMNLYVSEGNGKIAMQPGVYVVTVGNESFKVIVK